MSRQGCPSRSRSTGATGYALLVSHGYHRIMPCWRLECKLRTEVLPRLTPRLFPWRECSGMLRERGVRFPSELRASRKRPLRLLEKRKFSTKLA